jgi:tetratricopeptide (TPR) repeat protein
MGSRSRKAIPSRQAGALRRSASTGPASTGPDATGPDATKPTGLGRRRWLGPLALALALQVLTCAAYWPAIRGGMLWDDDKHVTSTELQSVDGLRRIWFEVGSTQQYYPIVHSAFWLQHRLWGDSTLGYHATNIVLHALSAFLVWVILKRLSVPGAALAAFVFALHPVQVESVAWMTELKNTLSGVFYLAAALTYLRFDKTRRVSAYGLAVGLFVLALMSKTVTATLPAALLVVMWWQRGALDLRRDAGPLAPLFAMGLLGGLVTTWIERVQIGAYGADFQFTLVERLLIAGRVVWFYLGKLVWPFDLMFIYPRWEISQGIWWQYVFPIALAGLIGSLWWVRARTRAPLAALLLFCGALFPAAGFVNVYPFRFSFVADHFQYLASVPAIAFAAAIVARFAPRVAPAHVQRGAAVLLLSALGLLTWNQSRQYADADTLYHTTIRLNPSCWMARINLGVLKLDGAPVEASAQFQEALRLKPDAAEAHYNLGLIDQKSGRLTEAEEHYRKALRFGPDLAVIHNNLGRVLQDQGRRDDAIQECERALQLNPRLAEAHVNLGALELGANNASAEAHLRAALRLTPDVPELHDELGNALQVMERFDEARMAYAEALRRRANYPEAHAHLGNLLRRMGRPAEAITEFREAIRLRPDFADAYYYLGNTLLDMGRLDEAAFQYRLAITHNPNDAAAQNNLGVVLESQGRMEEAAAQFRRALQLRPGLQEARDSLARVSAALRSGRMGAAR